MIIRIFQVVAWAVTAFIFFVFIYYVSKGPLPSGKTIIIEKNTSTTEIANRLYKNNIINSKYPFILLSKALDYRLKSGEYFFEPRVSPKEILRILQEGKSVQHKIVIPEGYTVQQIIDYINSITILAGEIKGDIKEGILFPSTYFYTIHDTKQQLIDNMRLEMERYISSVGVQKDLKDKNEILILASIVEKEADNDIEKPHIAEVYLNRLKKSMKLQADPTVIYAITNGQGKLERQLSKADLLVKSPYNTYLVFGLPPTPIACPGKKSIEAVINPTNTGDLFFVATGEGGHAFSKTFAEHLSNIAEFKRKKQLMQSD